MLKRRALLLLALCCAAPAQAGLFSDDDARKQIQQLEERVLKLETASEQQTGTLLDLLGQIDALNDEIRKLRGWNEELAHGLRDAEKREKDFYVDLDTRLRRFEPMDTEAAGDDPATETAPPDTDNPVPGNRAFEAAYGLFKGGSHENSIRAFQEFLEKYPESPHIADARYWLGNAQFALGDCESALATYRGLLKASPGTRRVGDTLLGIAECQQALGQHASAKKTLKQIIAKYPSSEAAARAKELIAAE